MIIELANDYLMVERDKPSERKTQGGLIIPEKAGTAHIIDTAKVVNVHIGSIYSVGDRVILARFTGKDVTLPCESEANGLKTYTIVKTEDILGVVK